MGGVSHTQDSFEGGMNLVDIGTRVKGNEYILGLNVRSRFGSLEPIFAPIDLTGVLPVENKAVQGLYAFGEILVCFIGGEAWYLDVSVSGGVWTQIVGFQMSAQVSRIYAQGVPAADLLYLRKNDGSVSNTSPNSGVILDPTSAAGTSEVALVCQDGINQPLLIFPDATFEISQRYEEWTKDNREYIPVGKQMAYLNGVLYVVSSDGKTIYRSVTGRPLDFVIAIDNNGDKVSNAVPTSIAVDSNEIKLIYPSNTENGGGLIVITAYTAYSLTPNFDKTLYAEPTFNKTFLFTAGTINQFCLTDLLGDLAFIDREGLKSFNSVQQLKFEGNNSVFSLGIAKLFKGIVQDDNACVGGFDNYTFFSVKTIYSPASIIVYDSVKEVFRSVDLLSSKPIKQFATTYSASRQRFFGATDDKIFELYSPDSTTPLSATVFTRELNSRNTDQGAPIDGIYNIRPQTLRLIFEEGVVDGEVNVDTWVNNNRPANPTQALGKTRDIPAMTGAIFFPVLIPVMFTTENSMVPIDINIEGIEGQKVGYAITWSGGAKLSYSVSRCDCKLSPTSIQQQSRSIS